MTRNRRHLIGVVIMGGAALLVAEAASARKGDRGWPFGRGRGRTAVPTQALTAKDLVLTPAVRDPQVSPDGKWVVFVQGLSRINSNDSFSNLYVVPVRGGKVRRLTATQKSDWGPRWSPDGKTIAFLSSRAGKPQIFTISPTGGEAVQRSKRGLGVGGPLVWSPRGDRLLFTGKVYPQCRDEKCNDAEAKRREQSKVKAELFTKLLYRHWNHWRHGKVKHVFSFTVSGGAVKDLTPGPQDAPPIALGGRQDYAFSPDGRELAFVSNTDKLIAASTNNDLFVMGSRGGRPRRITPSKANDHSPVYSPDGRTLAYLAMAVPKYEADRQRLVLYDPKSRKRRTLTEAFDRSVSEFVFAPNGRTIYFTAQDRGYKSIFAVPVAGGKVRTLVRKVYASSLRITPNGQHLVFVSQPSHSPAEVFRVSTAGGNPVALTNVHEALRRRVRMRPVEELWFQGAAGDRVHALVVKPPNFQPGRRYPLLVMVHGGPQGMSSDAWHPRWNAQLFAAPGYVVLMPNFHGSTGYGQKFTDAIRGDWGGKPYQDVMKSVDAALKKYRFIDKQRICAVGASYGGYMMNWIGTHTRRFRCLITHAGVYDLRSKYGTTEELWFPEREFHGTPWTNPAMYRKWSPSNYIKAWRTPTLVVHGQHDYRVTVGQGMQLFTALQRMGVPSRFLYFPDENHFVQKPQNRLLWWKTVHGWLAQYLKGRR
ncbi:MAG: S9 family peptidase [bacterium]